MKKFIVAEHRIDLIAPVLTPVKGEEFKTRVEAEEKAAELSNKNKGFVYTVMKVWVK